MKPFINPDTLILTIRDGEHVFHIDDIAVLTLSNQQPDMSYTTCTITTVTGDATVIDNLTWEEYYALHNINQGLHPFYDHPVKIKVV